MVEVTLRNTDVGDGVTLHWHGYDVPCGEDGVAGVTQDAVAPASGANRQDEVGRALDRLLEAGEPGRLRDRLQPGRADPLVKIAGSPHVS